MEWLGIGFTKIRGKLTAMGSEVREGWEMVESGVVIVSIALPLLQPLRLISSSSLLPFTATRQTPPTYRTPKTSLYSQPSPLPHTSYETGNFIGDPALLSVFHCSYGRVREKVWKRLRRILSLLEDWEHSDNGSISHCASPIIRLFSLLVPLLYHKWSSKDRTDCNYLSPSHSGYLFLLSKALLHYRFTV